MTATRPDPTLRATFVDPRGADRALQVSWHLDRAADDDLVVLSLWRGNVCTASFRLDLDDVPELVRVLSSGLGAAASSRRQDDATDHAAAAG